MSMVHCPECNKIVSQYAESCHGCGFPIKKFLDEHSIQNPENFLICPKCAYGYYRYYDFDPPHIKCEYCGEIIIETNVDVTQMRKLAVPANTHNQYEEECVKIAKLLGEFDQNEFNKRRKMEHEEYLEVCQYLDAHQHQPNTQPSTQVTCPYCKSTNTKKISIASRAGSILGFGIFSKKLGKQWHCNDCGSDF